MSADAFRRIDDGAAPAAWNMAVDEALLEACAAGEPGFPCLRLYAWDPPALSLGHHQDAQRVADLDALRELGIDLVRRLTGGRAVLHAREITYTVVASSRGGPLAGPVMDAYRRISEALAVGLRRLGIDAALSRGDAPARRASPEPCFARLGRCEIEAGRRKLVGSVQLQRGGCLLQHGSIPLSLDREILARVTRSRAPVAAWGLEEALGRAVGRPEAEEALAAGFAQQFGLPLRRGGLTPAERDRARRLERERYGAAAWNLTVPGARPPLGAG